MSKKSIIGIHALLSVAGRVGVPAKVDTGADSSAIWASDIMMLDDATLVFKLFGEGSEFYTGKVIKKENYKAVIVRSSNGQEQARYKVVLGVEIEGRKIKAEFTLSDRSLNVFPVLIGRRTLRGKFLVDVEKGEMVEKIGAKVRGIDEELRQNPVAFHKKYFKKEERWQ